MNTLCICFLLLLIAVNVAAKDLKTVRVSNLSELKVAMENRDVGRIFMKNSIKLDGDVLPVVERRILEVEADPDCRKPCTIDALGRSRIFNVGPGFGSGLILANLQLQNAFASKGNGSAINVENDSTLSSFNVSFLNNTNTAVESAAGFGGAIYGGLHAMLGFDHGFLSDNKASYGGAISCYGCQLAVTESLFSTNQGRIGGGSIYVENSNATVSLSKSKFLDNIGGTGGGGALLVGSKNSFDTNLSNYIGQVQVAARKLFFVNNIASGPGGAVRGDPFTTFALNGIDFIGNKGKGRGGGLALETANHPVVIVNSTFTENLLDVDMNYSWRNGVGGAGLSIGSLQYTTSPQSSVLNNVTFTGNHILKLTGESDAIGAGVTIFSGSVIVTQAKFSNNVNLNSENEQDMCVYGQNTLAMFNNKKELSACSACGGKGHCW